MDGHQSARPLIPTVKYFDERNDKEKLELGAIAKPTERFVVLPRPAEIRQAHRTTEDGIVIQDVMDLYGEDTMIVSDFRYFSNEAITADHLVPGETVVCQSAACESVLRGETPLQSEVVYLEIENLGINGADDIVITLEPYFSSTIESNHFHDVLNARQPREPIEVELPPLSQGQTLLVPLAAVAIFEHPAGEPGFVGVGDTRDPDTICWRDAVTSERDCRIIRDIYNSLVYYGNGRIPGGG